MALAEDNDSIEVVSQPSDDLLDPRNRANTSIAV